MKLFRRSLIFLLIVGFSVAVLIGCTRNEISFGTISDDAYTELLQIDTLAVNLSTVFRDSFETGNVTSLLLGRYRDPALGTISGKIYTQITLPVSLPDIPASAVFDSLQLIMRGNQYYYGDTSKSFTLMVHQLANNITTGYNSNLYNTSSVAELTPALGSKRLAFRPLRDDSIGIRLSDALGMEWMEKIRQQAVEMTEESSFLNYFKGISVSVDAADTAAVYGIGGDGGELVLRLFYHTVYPYKESHSVDFLNLQNELQFNQILHDRTGTGLVSSRVDRIEIPSTASSNRAFTQTGMSIWLKASFPSLRSILPDREMVKLLKAELILRPARLSYNDGAYRLPNQVFLVTTDGSNLDGSNVYDSSGTNVLYADPVIDHLYGENSYYRFNITNYINLWLNTPGSEQSGFFFRSQDSVANLTRLVVNDRFSGAKTAELKLQVLTIKDAQ